MALSSVSSFLIEATMMTFGVFPLCFNRSAKWCKTGLQRMAQMADMYLKLGLEFVPNTPEQYAAFINSEMISTAKVVKIAGIKPME